MTGLAPSPAAIALLLAMALVLATAARRHRRWPLRRTLTGLAGLMALAVASAEGLDQRAGELLSAHMLQHALIQLVAAPLLVASAPVRLALGTLPGAARRRLARLLHCAPLRTLSHPLSGLSIFAVTLALVHVPPIYEAALRHPILHAAEHALLLWSAIALWAPIVGADPLPRRTGPVARVGVLISAMVAMSALGATLASLPSLAYPIYAGPAIALGHDPLHDQALAGGIMWVAGMAIVLPTLVALAWNALWAEERAQRVRDARPPEVAGSGM